MRCTVGPNGEIVLPQTLMERLAIRPGDEIRFLEQDGAIVIRKVEGSTPASK